MLNLNTTEWLMLATGFLGAMTLIYLARRASRAWFPAPSVTCHFSPKGGCTDVVVQEIKNARHEVLVLAYSFTSKVISQALVDAKMRGLHVEIVLDHSNEKEEHTDLPFFMEQGLAPLIDAHHAIAHNKVMVIDGRTLVTGSFNFTRQAEIENAENLLVFKHHPDLIAAYRTNFQSHKAHARPPEIQKNATAQRQHKAA
jgi:phosphatidylserine/phosphatidylglycerophosphate/cardiolipin synthase-like enzyme